MNTVDKKLVRDAIEVSLHQLGCTITRKREDRQPTARLRKKYARLYKLFKQFGGLNVWWDENYN